MHLTRVRVTRHEAGVELKEIITVVDELKAQLVEIHPFDDGNGRIARLLMNLMLMQAGYVPVIVRIHSRENYLLALEKADVGELDDFISLIGEELIFSLELYLRGARGESLEDLEDIDKRVMLIQKRLEEGTQG